MADGQRVMPRAQAPSSLFIGRELGKGAGNHLAEFALHRGCISAARHCRPIFTTANHAGEGRLVSPRSLLRYRLDATTCASLARARLKKSRLTIACCTVRLMATPRMPDSITPGIREFCCGWTEPPELLLLATLQH